MPIDFAAIAATFQLPYHLQMRTITQVFERLSEWLRKRLAQANLLERNSRDFPSIRFYNEAVTLWISPLQHHTLTPLEPPRSFGASLRQAGANFAHGLGRIAEAVEEETLLPGLLAALGGILRAIDDSIGRFMEPTPELFDPTKRRASDIFGEAALGFRALGSSTAFLRGLAGQIAEARHLYSDFSARRARRKALEGIAEAFRKEGLIGGVAAIGRLLAPPEAAAAELAPEESLADTLDRGARYILGAILILPVLPDLLRTILGAGGIRLKLALLDALQGVERSVFDLRRTVLDTFYVELPEMIRHLVAYEWAVQFLVLSHLRFLLDFGFNYQEQLLASITTFLEDLSRFLRYWTVLIEGVRRLIEGILDFDLMPLILASLGLPGAVLAAVGPPVRFTIRDLLAVAGDVARIATRAAFTTWLYEAEAAVWAIPIAGIFLGRKLHRKFSLLRELVRIGTSAPRPLPAEGKAFVMPPGGFPNLYSTFVLPGLASFKGALGNLRDTLKDSVGEILGAGVDFLGDLSTTFDQASAEAATLGSPEQYRRLREGAEQIGKTVFGEEISTLRSRIETRGAGAVATAFEGWVADGGFFIIGEAIPLYVEKMDAFWREQQAKGEELTVTITATSPHILAQRAKLARVRMKELTIDASGRALDDALAAEVAARFREGVTDAYVTGRNRLRELGATP